MTSPIRYACVVVLVTAATVEAQSFSRRTVRAIVLQAAPVWLRSIYEDANYRFVYRAPLKPTTSRRSRSGWRSHCRAAAR
jgi:hypothetical protein